MQDHDFEQAAERQLMNQLGKLPREVAPGRDLWAGIEQRIKRPQRSYLRYALAAGVLLSGLAVFIGTAIDPAEKQMNQPQLVGVLPDTPDQALMLQQVRADLEPLLSQQLANLDPDTRQVVLDNLVIIQQAQRNIAEAMRQRPQSHLLGRHYQQLWQQEMDIYRRVSATRL